MDERTLALHNAELRESFAYIGEEPNSKAAKRFFFENLFDEDESVSLQFLVDPIDNDLKMVDPWSSRTEMNPYMQDKVWEECKNNIFFFLNRVLRVNKTSEYRFNTGNVILHYLCSNADSPSRIYGQMPHLSGKRLSMAIQMLWFKLFTTVDVEGDKTYAKYCGENDVCVPQYITLLSAKLPVGRRRSYENFDKFKGFATDTTVEVKQFMTYFANGQSSTKCAILKLPLSSTIHDEAHESFSRIVNSYDEITLRSLVDDRQTISKRLRFHGKNAYGSIEEMYGDSAEASALIEQIDKKN